jgi:hypothetical protein
MSKIALEGNASGTGTFTIAAPNTSSNFTLTLPVATGTVVVTGGAQTIEFAAGTALLPSITFTGDTNTGIFSPAADTIAFAEGGAEAMRITSAGEVLVGGTTSVDAKSGAVAIESTTGGDLNLIRDDTSTSSGESLGEIAFWGNDTGSPFTRAKFAYISAVASAVHGSGDNPTDLVFGTTPDNSATVTEVVRFTQAGNVGIGTSSPISKLNVVGPTGVAITLTPSGTTTGAADTGGGLYYQIYDGSSIRDAAYIYGNKENSTVGNYASYMSFWTRANGVAAAERMRITSGGNFLVGQTTADSGTAGSSLRSDGEFVIARNSATPIYINRLTNDGNLIDFAQASVTEGSISVSGSTVSYNGGHLSRWAQMLSKPTLFKGTVMSNLDEMNVYIAPTTYWTEEDELPEDVNVGDVKTETHAVDNEQLNKVKVSDVEGDVNVAGVFVNWEYDEDHQVDEINMAMTGDMIIRIAQGVVVQKGDLLMSAGDGTAKPQEDDIVRSKTVAKVTSNHVTCTYADGSYCVPCVLMAC